MHFLSVISGIAIGAGAVSFIYVNVIYNIFARRIAGERKEKQHRPPSWWYMGKIRRIKKGKGITAVWWEDGNKSVIEDGVFRDGDLQEGRIATMCSPDMADQTTKFNPN